MFKGFFRKCDQIRKKKTGDLVISTGEILKDTLKAFGDFKNKQKSV